MINQYHGVTFTGSPPRVTSADVRETEQRLHTVFPEDYRQFLETVNGGVPPPNEIPLLDSDEKVCVDFLYGIRPIREDNDLLYEQQRIISRTGGVLPAGFVTIGFDPGNAPYFISTQSDTTGKVYLYDPDGFLDANKRPKVHAVAHSFRDLLARIAANQ
jgi:hypothetical protein